MNQSFLHLRRWVLWSLCQAFQLQLLPDCQKVVEAVLLNLHLPVVDKVHHWYQIWSLSKRQSRSFKAQSGHTFSPLKSNGCGWSLLARRSQKNVLDADRITWKEMPVVKFDQDLAPENNWKQLTHIILSVVSYFVCSYLLTILTCKSHIRKLPGSSNLLQKCYF